MSAYVVSYDLMSPGQDYSKLSTYLRNLDSAKPLESVWLVSSTMSAGALRDEIGKHVDSNDKVVVIKLKDNWATWGSVPGSATAWLRKHVAA